MRDFLKLDHPFFAKPWRRYLTLATCAVWGGIEMARGATGWGMVFWGLGVVAFWHFRQIDWTKYDDKPKG